MSTISLIRTVPVLEQLLHTHREQLGRDFIPYRGHCYRVLNFCATLTPDPESSLHRIAIAAAFHDIGIWTHRTFDYLNPSIQAARDYLVATREEHLIGEVQAMIANHHRIRPACDAAGSLVEPFRRADWADVTGGLLAYGIPHQMVRASYAMWPDAGFHRKLVQLSWSRFKVHPLSPLPMLKF